METLSALLALWEGNPPVARWFPQQCVAYFPYCWPEPIVDKRLDAHVMSLKCRPVAFHCLCTIFFPFNNSICYLMNYSHLKRDCPLCNFHKHTSTICCQAELVQHEYIITMRHEQGDSTVKRNYLNENFGISIKILLRHVSKVRIAYHGYAMRKILPLCRKTVTFKSKGFLCLFGHNSRIHCFWLKNLNLFSQNITFRVINYLNLVEKNH